MEKKRPGEAAADVPTTKKSRALPPIGDPGAGDLAAARDRFDVDAGAPLPALSPPPPPAYEESPSGVADLPADKWPPAPAPMDESDDGGSSLGGDRPSARPAKRGSYRCGICGAPKQGHVCAARRVIQRDVGQTTDAAPFAPPGGLAHCRTLSARPRDIGATPPPCPRRNRTTLPGGAAGRERRRQEDIAASLHYHQRRQASEVASLLSAIAAAQAPPRGPAVPVPGLPPWQPPPAYAAMVPRSPGAPAPPLLAPRPHLFPRHVFLPLQPYAPPLWLPGQPPPTAPAPPLAPPPSVAANLAPPPPATPHPPIARQRGGPYPTAWLP